MATNPSPWTRTCSHFVQPDLSFMLGKLVNQASNDLYFSPQLVNPDFVKCVGGGVMIIEVMACILQG
jgi:hypothetical protein